MEKKIASSFVNLVTKQMMKEDLRLYELKKDVQQVKAYTDIAYCDHLNMDYYLPESEEQIEKWIIVDIHGGAWIYGDKKLNEHFCMHLSSYGFPVFNLNYDLVPNVSVKTQIQQIFLALHYIQEHEEEFHLKGYRLCLSGDSAGAHLASLVACITADKEVQQEYGVNGEDIQVAALLLQHGIYDLQMMKKTSALYMHKLYTWMFPKEDANLRNKDCLCRFLDANWEIPIFLLSSEKDTMFRSQTQELEKQLKKNKNPYELLYWDKTHDTQHVFHILHPDSKESQQSIAQMVAFLKRL